MEDNQQKIDNMIYIRGLPFRRCPLVNKDIIEGIMDYVPQDGDIVLSCYPKTGSTWLQYIVLQILSKGTSFPSIFDTVNKECPVMETVGKEVLNSMKAPRVYKHHMPYNKMQKNDKAKFIYIYRNPEDTCVSLYHFMNNITEIPDKEGLEEFFENFLTGNVGYGSYFKSILSYFEHKNDANLLLVSYERLKLNTGAEVLKIAKFLGEEYYHDISNNMEVMNNILEKINFDYMKKNLKFILSDPNEQNPLEIKDFFRKGTIGDGKQTLAAEQLTRLRKAAVEVLKDCEVLEEWYGKDLKVTNK